ncbi:hypothetical protein [Veillonella caviae]|uniref:hypothetical protein n=1 Tax=Veillonella caviae TaxID=248316 RepID=UPI0023F72959|nr:hypothetical protein [Veillonella caviae]MCF0157914.1 hypothetical protein [Veillonella sp.]
MMKINDRNLEVRSLTWTERDALIAAGLDFAFNPIVEDDAAELNKRTRDIMRFILKDVFKLSDDDLNHVSDKVAGDFASKVLTATYSTAEDAEKN